MKTLLSALTSVLIIPAFAYDNELTSREQSSFLSAIKSIGADTWEEGAFEYRYKSAGCNFKMQECWVYFEVTYRGRKDIAFCNAEGVKKFEDVYDSKTKTVTNSFYKKIYECMNAGPE